MNFHKIHHYIDLERNHHLLSYSIFFNLSYEQHQNGRKSQDSQRVLNFSNFPKFSNLWISKLCKIMTTSYELELCDSQKKTIPCWFIWCFSHIRSFVFYLLFLHVYYVCFSFLWYKGGEKGFSRVLLHMVYFYNLISHCLLWLSYEVLALVSMKAFGSSFIFSRLCCIIQLNENI